jgi:hypothetical protein
MKKDRSAKKKTRVLNAAESTFVLGTNRFAKISAVEGLALTRAMTARIKKFDRDDTPAEERRRAIIRVYRKG